MTITLTSPIDAAYDDVKSSTRKAKQALLVRFLRWVLKGIEKRLVRNFTRINMELEGLLNMITENQSKLSISEADYKQFRQVVSWLVYTNENYREVNYIDSKRLGEIMNSTLTLAYEIEAELKIAAQSHKKPIPTDAEYKKALSTTSGYALSKKLSHSF